MAFRSSTMRGLIAAFVAAAALCGCAQPKPRAAGGLDPRPAGETRPNVLLILVDHLGPEIDVYGDKTAETPNLDRLAREGEVFDKAYAASGSDDAAYAAILTGVYPQTIGMVQEWTAARVWTVAPPAEIRGFPETLRAAGYDTFHIGPRTDPFGASSALWTDETVGEPGAEVPVWPQARLAQPFFGEIDLSTVGAESEAATPKTGWWSSLFSAERKKARELQVKPVDPQAVVVPAYLPDSHSTRVALARRYETIERLDAEIGLILAKLDKLGLLASTDVIVAARAGPALPRAERTLYESGVRIPLIVRRADGRFKGVARQDLVSAVDIAPSILTRAGLKPFAWMQGRERFQSANDPEKYVYSTQNRVGAVFERAFAVRDGRWLYIHNLAFDTPIILLARQTPALSAFRAVSRGSRRVERPDLPAPPTLNPAQTRITTRDRPEDELYDLAADPFQLTNLAEEDKYGDVLQRLSDSLNAFAASAPDYSTWDARDLQDLYRPGGVTPTAAQPAGGWQAGRLTLDTATPGATILWRLKGSEAWRLYTGPVSAAAADVEAKTARYGFVDSGVVAVAAPTGKR